MSASKKVHKTYRRFDTKLAHKLGLTTLETKLFKKLNSPEKIQDFLNSLPNNLEKEEETLRSVRESLNKKNFHCIEGALIAALALYLHGEPPLILDMRANNEDDDHVVTLFKERGYWGVISKSNRSVLRFRDAVYKTIRELMMSYVHEYFLPTGKKTLREYSQPLDLRKVKKINWVSSRENLWELSEYLDSLPHSPVLPKHKKNLRRVDPIELKANVLKEYD
jgi:hypothetical protein